VEISSRSQRLQPTARSLRLKRYEYPKTRRRVRFTRQAGRLVRWLTCLHCDRFYRADYDAPPVHCGRAVCANVTARRKRRSLAAWV